MDLQSNSLYKHVIFLDQCLYSGFVEKNAEFIRVKNRFV
jgi:hypothetical protein